LRRNGHRFSVRCTASHRWLTLPRFGEGGIRSENRRDDARALTMNVTNTRAAASSAAVTTGVILEKGRQ
jgi:hypothetical protein